MDTFLLGENNRLKNSALNALTAFAPTLVLIVLGLLTVRALIVEYGAGVNGLNQVALNLVAYLNVIEAGFGQGIVYSLFGPLAEKNPQRIAAIINGARRLFMLLGLAYLVLLVAASFLYPLAVKETAGLSYVFSVAVVLIVGLRVLSDYFVAGPYPLLLVADQKQYVVNLVTKIFEIATAVVMLVLILAGIPFLIVVGVQTLLIVLRNLTLLFLTRRRYTAVLHSSKEKDRSFMSMTKSLIVHKISEIVVYNADTIVISIALGFTAGGIYAVYVYVFAAISSLFKGAFVAPTASFGNLLVTQPAAAYDLYKTLQFIIGFLSTVIFASLFASLGSFISLYVGPSFSSPELILVLSITGLFDFIRTGPIVLTGAAGLYRQTQTIAIVEALIILVFSIAGVILFGLPGVVAGKGLGFIFRIVASGSAVLRALGKKQTLHELSTHAFFTVVLVMFVALASFLVPQAGSIGALALLVVGSGVVSLGIVSLFSLLFYRQRFLGSFKMIASLFNPKKAEQ